MRNREEASELRGWLRPEHLGEAAVRGLFSAHEAQGASDLSLEAWGAWSRKVGGQPGARGGCGRWESTGEGGANTVRGWVLETPLLNSI